MKCPQQNYFNFLFNAAKDRLYNQIVKEMTQKGAFFPNTMDDNSVSKLVDVVVNTMWYIDEESKRKLSLRCSSASNYSFPERYNLIPLVY